MVTNLNTDDTMKKIVEALSLFPGVDIIDAYDSQSPLMPGRERVPLLGETWTVGFYLKWSAAGWRVLEILAHAAARSGNVSLQVYAVGKGAGRLCFVLIGIEGQDPDLMAEAIIQVKEAAQPRLSGRHRLRSRV